MGVFDQLASEALTPLRKQGLIGDAPQPVTPSAPTSVFDGLITQVPDTQKTLEQGSVFDTIGASPQPMLTRKPGERRKEYLSQEGAPTQPYYAHLPPNIAPPTVDFEPTSVFDEGPDKPPAGKLANKAIDVGKAIVGSVTDPESWLAGGLTSRILKGGRLATTPPTPPTPPSSPVRALPAPTPPKQLTGPPAPAPSRALVPSSGGKPPMRIEPPEPPERLGADGTYRYEPWRQNYDVYVADWRDPNLSWWDKLVRRLPADYKIATKEPESPVIGMLDRPPTDMMNWTDDLVHGKVRDADLKALGQLDENLFVTEEAKAVAMWKQSRAPGADTAHMIPPRPGQVGMQIVGQSPEKSFDEIMQHIDPRVRPWFQLFHDRMKIDQQSRAILGLEHLDEVPYPYLPRIAQQDWDRLMTIQRGDQGMNAVSSLSTSLKGFQQARSYDTMSEGLAKGMTYEDPKRALLMRLMVSKQMEFTANMMKELKGTVMFETKEQARAEMLRRLNVESEPMPTPGAQPGRPVPDRTAWTDPAHTRDLSVPTQHNQDQARTLSMQRGPDLADTARLARERRQLTPSDEPVAVRGLPGPQDKIWFVPSKTEALALHQHLSGHKAGGFWGQASAVMNQFFRNPNLMNPAPHVIKNMGYKYVIAAAGLGRNPVGALKDLAGYSLRMPTDFLGLNSPIAIGRLSKDATEYAKNLNPRLIAEFNREMPFSRTAATAYENLKPFLERSKPWALTQILGKYLTGNAWSSKYIFSQADPAMKYSLWKMYREKGMSPTAAANQVNIDLVRYTLRSDLTDTWKNVPLNFFVPWRTGTIMATAKQLSTQPWSVLAKQQAIKMPLWAATRPFKTSLLIGAWMMGREAYYRETGYTHHLPIDYINGPLAQLTENPLTLPYIAASTYLMGPGADPVRTATNLKDVFGVLKGTEDMSKLMEMYWGLSQIYGSGKEFVRFAESLDKHGVAGADYGALAHVLMGAALAEYESYGYKAKHLEHYLPESAIPYDPNVKKNLDIASGKHAAAELRKPLQQLRRDAQRTLQHDRVHPPD